MINASKLDKELKAAGIAFSGCNSDGMVWDIDGVTEIQDRPDVVSVIAVHDPIEQPESVIRFDKPIAAPDFIVASRDIKTDPAQALAEAIAEAMKPHGEAKSLDLIARSLAVVVENMEKRLKKAKI